MYEVLEYMKKRRGGEVINIRGAIANSGKRLSFKIREVFRVEECTCREKDSAISYTVLNKDGWILVMADEA